MKKWFSFLLALVLLVPACDAPSDNSGLLESDKEIEELEEQVQQLEEQLQEKEELEQDEKEQEKLVDEEIVEEVEPVVIEEVKYTGENTIKLVSPTDGENFEKSPITFTGTVSPNTTKVVATAYYYASFDSNQRSTDVYTLTQYKAGDTSFTYRASMDWDNLGFGSNDYMFTAYFEDGTQKSVSVSIYYDHPEGMGKPVIYLYPEKPTKISVVVTPEQGVFVSEPEMGDGWTVIANAKGALFNLSDRQYYPYLFWEAYTDPFPAFTDGFVIPQTELKKFFDDKLAYLGMNAKETADFEEYWLGVLTEKPYYFIHFVDQALLDKYAPLSISPKPDSILRVFFDYEGLDSVKQVPAQKLSPWTRSGYSVVEWGGSLF